MAFRLSDKRCEDIKKIVVDTFEKLDIRCIPINGFEMASKLNAVVVPYSSKPQDAQILMKQLSEDGFVVMRADIWYIFYNDRRRYDRLNNTLVHECGHIVLDHAEESELAEAEAKFFAKYALAPPPLIHKLEAKTAIEVHNAFDISLQAAEYALDYYHKWLTYGNKDYTGYEKRSLQLFKETV